MAIATGRVVGRVVDGQPSFTGNYGDKKSRPDHVLLPPALYKLVCSFKMRGEQSGWTPDPDEFEIPDLSVLEGVVCCQFQKLEGVLVLLQGSMLSLFLLLSMRACL